MKNYSCVNREKSVDEKKLRENLIQTNRIRAVKNCKQSKENYTCVKKIAILRKE